MDEKVRWGNFGFNQHHFDVTTNIGTSRDPF